MTLTVATPRKNARKTTNGFWWANLATSDAAAAAEFYTRLFGWSYDELPIDENFMHRNATLGGLQIAGIDSSFDPTMPTAWTNFVYVDDINATVAKAKELGATIAMEPADVMGEGHMAMLIDPQGAFVGLWKSGRHTGADAVNQPGTYTWAELATSDLGAAREFYSALFGWSWERMESTGDFEYWLAANEGLTMAGAYAKMGPMADMPTNWGAYFGTADIQACAAEVVAAGGKVVVGPEQMGPGTGIGAIDPQGGFFFAIQMDEWPED